MPSDGFHIFNWSAHEVLESETRTRVNLYYFKLVLSKPIKVGEDKKKCILTNPDTKRAI